MRGMAVDDRSGPLEATRTRARARLAEIGARLEAEGMASWRPRGRLIRPVLAIAAAESHAARADARGFWPAVAAVQMAHEASLVHDDIVDGADERRGEPSVVAARGVGGALIAGDHLLTSAYRLAHRTGSLAFAMLFGRAVERTVAAEKRQAASAGEWLDEETYRTIACEKSGHLLACSVAAAAALVDDDPAPLYALGRRLGMVYQMLDDLLDYCPDSNTGKPALQDYAQRRWTWPLLEAPGLEFGLGSGDLLARMRAVDDAGPADSTPLRRCLSRFETRVEDVRARAASILPDDAIVPALLDDWLAEATTAVAASHERARGDRTAEAAGATGARRVFEAHSKSFSFAARLFPADMRDRVAKVYAYCRRTDDIVDRVAGSNIDETERRLGDWLRRSRAAYAGTASGIDVIDGAMLEMARAGVRFDHVEALVEGMRMDLRSVRYETFDDLRLYTYRVASVVGLWLTELWGVHHPRVLERASQMGHAMQLTNIARDVGDDWRAGRLYLPRRLLARHGLAEDDIERMADGGPIPTSYVDALEELMAHAERAYDEAFEAIPHLPRPVQGPVAIAASVYRGIHGALRRIGYDNFRLRAHTRLPGKVWLGARALVDLHHARRRVRAGRVAMAG